MLRTVGESTSRGINMDTTNIRILVRITFAIIVIADQCTLENNEEDREVEKYCNLSVLIKASIMRDGGYHWNFLRVWLKEEEDIRCNDKSLENDTVLICLFNFIGT